MDRPLEPLFPQPVIDALGAAPSRPAFEAGGRVVTRSELLDLIRRFGNALRDAGLRPGDGVAMVTSVTPEAFAVRIAAHTVGCRVVGIRPGYPPAQLAATLGAGIHTVVADKPAMTPDLPSAAGSATLLHLEDLPGPDDGRPITVEARPADVARLIYTSGSTGLPKGCAQTYEALTAHWAFQPATWSPVVTGLAEAFQRCLVFGTLSSPVVMDYLLLCLLSGGTAVVPDPDPRGLFPYALERHRITGSIMTVPRLHQMLDALRDEPADLGSLRALVVAGSPLNPRRLAAATETLGPVVYQGYGQSEAGLISILTPAQIAAGPPEVLTSVGHPLSLVEIAVRDGNRPGADLATGETGEIWLRSPYMMTGYWDDPEQTADTVRDGWLRTRDLGYLDERGMLHLVGRARDVIIVNAEICYAGPIENVLIGHPDVDQAYVVGRPDERTGEAVHAFVVPAGDRVPDRAALAEAVRTALGAASVPSTITIVTDVPVAASGKVDKRALADRRP
jgi:fatty-acyl-CoA synthase